MTQSDRLRRIMQEHELSIQDIANICKVSVEAVRNWIYPSRPQDAPEGYVDLVVLTLKQKG